MPITNHASLITQPGMQSTFGDGLDRIVVVPLARGPMGYYSDISEADVLLAVLLEPIPRHRQVGGEPFIVPTQRGNQALVVAVLGA